MIVGTQYTDCCGVCFCLLRSQTGQTSACTSVMQKSRFSYFLPVPVLPLPAVFMCATQQVVTAEFCTNSKCHLTLVCDRCDFHSCPRATTAHSRGTWAKVRFINPFGPSDIDSNILYTLHSSILSTECVYYAANRTIKDEKSCGSYPPSLPDEPVTPSSTAPTNTKLLAASICCDRAPLVHSPKMDILRVPDEE